MADLRCYRRGNNAGDKWRPEKKNQANDNVNNCIDSHQSECSALSVGEAVCERHDSGSKKEGCDYLDDGSGRVSGTYHHQTYCNSCK